MQLIDSVWRFGLPLVVLASSALMLASAVRSREKPAPLSPLAVAFIVLAWLVIAGEAAFGDQRPVFERQWKGAAALLLALSGAIHLWRRYRHKPAPASRDQPALAQPRPRSDLAVLVTMPALGEDIGEGTVTRWLKQVGDRVEAGEPLVEVSIDKVDVEIPADASGELHEIRVPAGTTAPVGTTIAVIEPRADMRDGRQRSS